jgi:hypothetical protein
MTNLCSEKKITYIFRKKHSTETISHPNAFDLFAQQVAATRVDWYDVTN